MKTVTVTNQAEWNALPASFTEFTSVEIHSDPKIEILVRTVPDLAQVRAYDSSQVTAYGSSQVRAYGSSQVRAYDSSQVTAYGSSQVTAYDSSQVRAYDSSQVTACDSSQVRAYGSSQVRAYDSSQVTACDSSQVTAYGSSQVTAYDSSQVTAYGSSQVRAYDSSQVRAYDSSQVTACDSSQVTAHTDRCAVELSGFAVATMLAKAKLKRKGKTTTVVTPKVKAGVDAWLERHGITPTKDRVILFKRVSKDLKTQEGQINETTWTIGATLTMPDDKWDPSQECGPGKFHACPTTFFCDQFRSERGDKYIALEVAVKDLHLVDKPEYPHKIALRSAKVMHVCDWMGKAIA